MDTLATSIEIDQPPSRVYAFLTDDENLPLWATDVLKVERLHGDIERCVRSGSVALHLFGSVDTRIPLGEVGEIGHVGERLGGRHRGTDVHEVTSHA